MEPFQGWLGPKRGGVGLHLHSFFRAGKALKLLFLGNEFHGCQRRMEIGPSEGLQAGYGTASGTGQGGLHFSQADPGEVAMARAR